MTVIDTTITKAIVAGATHLPHTVRCETASGHTFSAHLCRTTQRQYPTAGMAVRIYPAGLKENGRDVYNPGQVVAPPNERLGVLD